MSRPLTPVEQAWVDEQVAAAPPLSEAQVRRLSAILGAPERKAS